jgi:hypothetical protein
MKVLIVDGDFLELKRIASTNFFKTTLKSGSFEKRLPKEREFTKMLYNAGLIFTANQKSYTVAKDVTHNHIGRKIEFRTLKRFLDLYDNIEVVERFELSPEEFTEYNNYAQSN